MPMFFKSLIFIMFLVGPILLQIFLSKRENKWLGLILPMINILISIMAVLGIAFYGNESAVEIVIQLLGMFLLWNIPTVILIAIYFACREKFKKKKELDKMNIQDM
jgi:uncharacterized membrane protein YoaK (UPF0700 family)